MKGYNLNAASTCANDRLEFVDAIVFFPRFILEFIFSAYISLSVQTMVSNLKLLLILKRGKIVGFPLFNLLVAIFIYYLHGWFIEILLRPLQINWTVLFFFLLSIRRCNLMILVISFYNYRRLVTNNNWRMEFSSNSQCIVDTVHSTRIVWSVQIGNIRVSTN